MPSKKSLGITGESVLEGYLKGDPECVAKYSSLCAVLNSINQWSEKSIDDYFSQILPCARLFEHQCHVLIENLCGINWTLLNNGLRPRFAKFLRDVAVLHIFHSETILMALFDRLTPTTDSNNDESVSTEDVRESIYSLARDAICYISEYLPKANNLIVRCAQKVYPHQWAPAAHVCDYTKNLILIADYCGDISQELWKIIIGNALHIDATISKSISQNAKFIAGDSLFADDENQRPLTLSFRKKEQDLTVKLDRLMTIMLARISKGYGSIKNDVNASNVEWVDTITPSGDVTIFEQLWPAFTDRVMLAHDVQSVSFLWFYMCSLEERFQTFMLKMLWKMISIPVFAPNEWRKAQTAATFLGGFLARANYITFETAVTWMKKMSDWCNCYIDKSGLPKNTAGSLQHGTFYSVVQALLFIFCFRYREFVDNDYVQEVHTWGLPRIIHSHFEPLKYMSKVIAIGFATISRRLQIVYCCHILDSSVLVDSPIEHYLPFSFLQLPMTSLALLPLIKRFEPAEDDLDAISSDIMEASSAQKNTEKSVDAEFDFMDDDEEMVVDSAKANITGVLSTSPFSQIAAGMHYLPMHP